MTCTPSVYSRWTICDVSESLQTTAIHIFVLDMPQTVSIVRFGITITRYRFNSIIDQVTF